MSNEQDNKMIITRGEYDSLQNEITRLIHRNRFSSDDKFWIYCWTIIGITLIAIVTLMCTSIYAENKLFADIIAKSPENAMQIACAQDATSSQTSPACTIYLAKLK
ncbi:hypothetical protein [Flavobacterium sp.]|jgi:hypothetical protein|uniref:hypothetical protein n=1 Tax=Flavobacterium sp. TaxID=239 RepID=UPI0037C15C8A